MESNWVSFGVLVRIGVNLTLIPLLGGLWGVIGLASANLISLALLLLYLIIVYTKIRNSGLQTN